MHVFFLFSHKVNLMLKGMTEDVDYMAGGEFSSLASSVITWFNKY